MEKYVKPLCLANEDLAEGIYAASGDCMNARVTGRVDPDGTHRFEVYYEHRAWNDHCSTGAVIKIRFSAPMYLSDTNQYACSGNGTTEIAIIINNALHSDGDCQTTFNIVGKPVNGGTAEVLGWSISDKDYRIVDDHIKH